MEAVIRFRLDPRTGLPSSRQIVDQVRQAIRLGRLLPGDQLPSVRDVVGQIPINPNTVHRAYRDLEQLGLVEGRPGVGTFIAARALRAIAQDRLERLTVELQGWLAKALRAGLDRETVLALVTASIDARSADASSLP